MTRAAQARIDLEALQNNLTRVKETAPASNIMAVIKANGYGHGMVRVAKALSDAQAFAVASIDEAIELRDAGIDKPIVLLEGFNEASELPLIARYHLSVVIHHSFQLELLEHGASTEPVEVWLKADTGMHRLGFTPGAIHEIWRRLEDCPSVASPVRLMTHMACADEPDNPMTDDQIAMFTDIVKGLDAECSLANSATLLGWQNSHAQWVRPGIMLYGVNPFIKGVGKDIGLEPVMTFSSKVIAVNRLNEGDTIGYGASWTCPEDMSVGVVAVGYGDGYPRHAEQGTPVLINNQHVPLIGRVSMDMITLDLRSHPDVSIGDEVILWGEGLPVEEIAKCSSTIAYELLCGVTQRVRFVY